jgi:hypothetical protein
MEMIETLFNKTVEQCREFDDRGDRIHARNLIGFRKLFKNPAIDVGLVRATLLLEDRMVQTCYSDRCIGPAYGPLVWTGSRLIRRME